MSAPAVTCIDRAQVMALVTHALLDAANPGANASQVMALLYKRLDALPVVTLAEPPAGGSVTREMGPVS